MELIIIIIIAFLIIRFFKKNKSTKEEETFNAPAAGSRAGKKAMKEFQMELRVASGDYGFRANESMEKVAEAYALGNGVEKDIEKAKQWKERQVRAELQQKTYISEYEGASGYTPEDCLNFFMDGKLIPADWDKAEELAWLLSQTGTNKSAGILKKILKHKYPQLSAKMDINRIIADYPVVCAGKNARSKKIYDMLCEEMKGDGVSGQAAVIEWLLKKAEWNVPVKNVAFPGASAELEKQFSEARAIEAKGQDFKQAAAAYEPIAEAGHSEAMRRLGLIKRDITSENACTAEYASGQSWIEKAAQAGNALASHDLGDKTADVAFIAGLAGQGNLDALYALGCMVEKGQGGKANWDIAQAIFRNMEQLIGDPIAHKNGEGIEWLRKLGNKFNIIDDNYYIKLADAGSGIGYAPSQTELLYMSHEMMRRAYEKSNDKAGSSGDFGYCAYIIELSKEPQKAGIARAKKIAGYCQEEQMNYSRWREKRLKEAEAGTGTWQYTADKFSPKERVARTITSIHHDIKTIYFTRCQRGMNYFNISDKLRKSENYDASVAEFMKTLTKVARNTYGTAESTISSSEYVGRNGKDSDSPFTILDLPNIVTGPYGVTYRMTSAGSDAADYWGDDGSSTTIHLSDIGMAGNSARNSDGYFYW